MGSCFSQSAGASSRFSTGAFGGAPTRQPAHLAHFRRASGQTNLKSRPWHSDYSPPSARCCTQFEWVCGYEIVTRSSVRAEWLRDLWATLAGRPHSPVPAPDFTTLQQLEIVPDEQLIRYFEQHPVPVVAHGIDLASP